MHPNRSNAMKKNLVALTLCCIAVFAPAEDIVFPPELYWWIQEVNKVNQDVKVSDFKLETTERHDIDISDYAYKDSLYPVFKRWNYSGNVFAYYDLSTTLSKAKDGRYVVSGDIDSAIGFFTRDGEALFVDAFGSTKGINAMGWIRDGVLIATGIWISSEDAENPRVDLFIRRYQLRGSYVIIDEYIYANAFRCEAFPRLSLNWWEQRKDYFR